MGILHEIAQREHERDELIRYLDFYNVRTPKRENRERRLHEVENELRVLRHQNCDRANDRTEV